MPPFILEALKHAPFKERRQKIIVTKGVYNPKVKISDWESYGECEPIDIDPFCPGNVNHHLSHYKRLGIEQDDKYVTTTQLMLNQINEVQIRPDVNKRLINYYTYYDNMDCESDSLQPSLCPETCAEKYYSTMQNSYRPPYFYKMRRLALPKTPFLSNRKFHFEEPTLSEYKFYDEGFHTKTRELIKYKSSQWKSFNPCTGLYNDGTAPPSGKKQCVFLNYEGF